MIKVAIVQFSNTGASTFINTFVHNDGQIIYYSIWENYVMTCGDYIFVYTWYDYIRSGIYEKFDIMIVMYDITRRDSYNMLNIEQLEPYIDDSTRLILVGTKKDLEDDREVLYEEGENYANENNMYFREINCHDINDVKQVIDIYHNPPNILVKSAIN